jgi:hypothetical protein
MSALPASSSSSSLVAVTQPPQSLISSVDTTTTTTTTTTSIGKEKGEGEEGETSCQSTNKEMVSSNGTITDVSQIMGVKRGPEEGEEEDSRGSGKSAKSDHHHNSEEVGLFQSCCLF